MVWEDIRAEIYDPNFLPKYPYYAEEYCEFIKKILTAIKKEG